MVAGRGFALMSVEAGDSDPETGRLYWLDALFFRDATPAASGQVDRGLRLPAS